MEEVFLRFPHLAESLYENLDNQNLSKCREVGQSWKSFIDNNDLLWIRIKKRYPLQNGSTAKKEDSDSDSDSDKSKDCGNFCMSDLHLAALTGQTEIFKILLEESLICKKNLETPSWKLGVTPFHLAAEKGRLEICRVIVEKIGNPSTKDKYLPYWNGKTMDMDKMNEMWKEISLILKSTKKLQDQSPTAFEIACQNRQEKVARYLLENASILKLNLATCFRQTYINGNISVAEFIINNASFDFNKVLQGACFEKEGGMEIIHLLIGKMDIEKIDANAILKMACRRDLWKVKRLLMENSSLASKINFNEKGENGQLPFHIVCKNGNTGFAEFLIEKSKEFEIDLNAQDNQGMTGFHLACKKGQTLPDQSRRLRILGRPAVFHGIVKLIIRKSDEFKIDLNIEDKFGNTGISYFNIRDQKELKHYALKQNIVAFQNLTKKQ